jgi:hypothetical protein
MSTPDAGKMRSGEQEACCMGFVTSNGADHEPGCHNASPRPGDFEVGYGSSAFEPPEQQDDAITAVVNTLEALKESVGAVSGSDSEDLETLRGIVAGLIEYLQGVYDTETFDFERADDEMPGTVTASVPIPLHPYVAPESTSDGLGCAYEFPVEYFDKPPSSVRCNLPPGMHRLLKSTAGR